jgi:hypothetical protein
MDLRLQPLTRESEGGREPDSEKGGCLAVDGHEMAATKTSVVK